MDVVVREGPAILELLAGEDQPLLIRRDALLVLDLGLDILDGVRGLDLEGDGLAREGLDENLHLGRKFARPYLPTMKPEKEDVYKISDLFVRLPKLSIKIKITEPFLKYYF